MTAQAQLLNPGGVQPWSKPAEKRVIFAGYRVHDLPVLKGRYKGVDEASQITSLAEYERSLNFNPAFFAAMEGEETILLLGAYDSRARRKAYLCDPLTLDLVADLGFMGEIEPREADLFEGITAHDGKVWTCMTAAQWQKYESLKAQGVDLTELGPDWHNATILWTCATGVYREWHGELAAANTAPANDNEVPSRYNWFGEGEVG